eukprot:GEMP01007611.1.p1 GENE.GEMP01007611.1~~GEMP01007611.1.p1  ORF type:complete len:704 (+),score=119.08 GEMP01007611.1:952-3063(+)
MVYVAHIGFVWRWNEVVDLGTICSRKKSDEVIALEKARKDIEIAKEEAALEKEEKTMKASLLGKKLSEQTTRTVITGVLCMMIVLPFIGDDEVNLTLGYALENIFWFGLSSCTSLAAFNEALLNKTPIKCTNNNTDAWITPEGYHFMLYELAQSSRYQTSGRHQKLFQPLLYLKVLDLAKSAAGVNGSAVYGSTRVVNKIEALRCTEEERTADYTSDSAYEFNIPPGYMPRSVCQPGTCCWEAHSLCQDFAEGCPWRESEMQTVTFSPPPCGADGACRKFFIKAIFLNRRYRHVLAKDVQPTPFFMLPEEEEDHLKQKPTSSASGGTLDTSMLENTILKIGSLLLIGFGETGAQIIGKNMASQDGELNIFVPGRKMIGVFGFCDVRDFTHITECLMEEVMVFVNKLARIVHICVHWWDGAASSNIGDSFLVTWVLADPEENRKVLVSGYEKSAKVNTLVDKALMAFLKIGVELRRASDVLVYTRHPKIIPKFGMDFHVSMGCGIHVGWAIEGPVGSEYKIDATYLSPHVNLPCRLQSATRMYGIDTLFSRAFHQTLSPNIQERCRQVDVVKLKGQSQESPIYTFGVNEEVPKAPEGHEIGHVIPPSEITAESLKAKGIEHCILFDQDIVTLQKGVTMEFQNTWRQGLNHYINGKWSLAVELFTKCTESREFGDGPSECLLNFIQSHNGTAPDDWEGYRSITFK